MTTALDSLSVAVTADTSAFTKSMADAEGVAKKFGNTITSSFATGIVTGRSLTDTVSNIGLRLSAMALNAALKPVSETITSSAQGLFSSLGKIGTDSVSAPLNILPFAKGGVVSSPSYFPMTNGNTGLMGERGAEAIVPLSRGPDGRLGIASQQGGGGSVVVNISTPDAASFRRSEADVSAAIARAVARGQRNL
jgi:phage-related minor tail protein